MDTIARIQEASLMEELDKVVVEQIEALRNVADKLVDDKAQQEFQIKCPAQQAVTNELESAKQEFSLEFLQEKKKRLQQAISELELTTEKMDVQSEKFEIMKNAALFCKLCTGTLLVTSQTKVTGLIPSKGKCFEYSRNDPTITERLWNDMK